MRTLLITTVVALLWSPVYAQTSQSKERAPVYKPTDTAASQLRQRALRAGGAVVNPMMLPTHEEYLLTPAHPNAIRNQAN